MRESVFQYNISHPDRNQSNEIKKEITEIDNSLKFEEVSNYLKEGLTQSQIAQNMMVAQSTVSKWINIMRKQYPHLLKGTKYEKKE